MARRNPLAMRFYHDARRNPLAARPPSPRHGREHRLGVLVAESVQRQFAHVDDNVHDLYYGVHVTKHPIVATAYALDRRKLNYNDFALIDVVDPPVLIGLRVDESEEHIDADGYVKAQDILRVARDLIQSGHDPDEVEGDVDLYDEWHDYSRSGYFADDVLDYGPGYVGGSIGNYPDAGDFARAVACAMRAIEEQVSEDDLLRLALRLAASIVPQSRVMRDLDEDDVVAVIVLAPYALGGEEDGEEDAKGEPFTCLGRFARLETVEEYDQAILADAEVLYGDPRAADRWHGTSLSAAAEALPGILTHALVEEGKRLGSPYDHDALEAAREEYLEEEEVD